MPTASASTATPPPVVHRWQGPALTRTLRALGMHDLRHTAISHWVAAGLDVVTVQRRAGHASPSITLDLYSHGSLTRNVPR